MMCMEVRFGFALYFRQLLLIIVAVPVENGVVRIKVGVAPKYHA